ncbi:MAG: ATP-binding protein [Oscillochloridaceae bacterium]|nr:ATP-binding protein [Chloroflexaceae bacterium]MDW8391215.1 ATP-binding protein [Oscillochloridaceae bacterium]
MTLRSPEFVRLDLPARYTYLHLVSESLADMLQLAEGVADLETLIYNVQLATHEACTNIINHAYRSFDQGRILVEMIVHFEKRLLQIDLYDTGTAFDLDSVPAPDLDQVRVHGYGLFLIRHLMDTVTYTAAPDRNHWRMIKTFYVRRCHSI